MKEVAITKENVWSKTVRKDNWGSKKCEYKDGQMNGEGRMNVCKKDEEKRMNACKKEVGV